MFNNPNDPIGFNPTQNQSEFGTPRVSPYGTLLRAIPPMAQVDYFPTSPLRGVVNYIGAQGFGHPVTESLYAKTHGYRGILPIDELPFINKPYPYEVG